MKKKKVYAFSPILSEQKLLCYATADNRSKANVMRRQLIYLNSDNYKYLEMDYGKALTDSNSELHYWLFKSASFFEKTLTQEHVLAVRSLNVLKLVSIVLDTLDRGLKADFISPDALSYGNRLVAIATEYSINFYLGKNEIHMKYLVETYNLLIDFLKELNKTIRRDEKVMKTKSTTSADRTTWNLMHIAQELKGFILKELTYLKTEFEYYEILGV